MSADLIGTMVAGLLTSGVGAAAYVSSVRNRRRQDVLDERTAEAEAKVEATETAVDMERAEREGWIQLIHELRDQVREGNMQIKEMRVAASENRIELRLAHERCAVLENDLRRAVKDRDGMGERLTLRILALRDEVTRLGGNVDEINRVGKTGQPGDKGETGDKGPRGDASSFIDP